MSRLIGVIALLCALCHFVSCFAVVFEDCGSKLAKVTKVSVLGCRESDEKCNLVRGTNETIRITFVPNENISEMNAYVYGVIASIPVPFPINKPDVCKDLDSGVKCPLQKDQEYNYKNTIFVQKKYPKINVDIKWEFMTDKNKMVVCILFPAKIT